MGLVRPHLQQPSYHHMCVLCQEGPDGTLCLVLIGCGGCLSWDVERAGEREEGGGGCGGGDILGVAT